VSASTGDSGHRGDSTAVHGADLVIQGGNVLREDLEILQLLTGAEGVEPLGRAHTDAYRLDAPAHMAGVAEACAAAGYDWALVPRGRARSRVRLVAMDMDSTLITIECIDELAAASGIGDEVAAITAAAMRGEIDFRASLARRVALLEGLHVSDLARVYDERLRLSEGAERLLEACRRIGATTLLVSGGFTFFTERLRTRLGLDYTLANELEIDGDRLTGRLSGAIVDAAAKAGRFVELADRCRGDGGIAVAIGDGANDLPLLAAADVSIAYRAKPLVRAQAMHAIDHCGLDAVLNLFA
jgi:phosphoserine phosphatase